MELYEAISVIRTLADGVNPITGNTLDPTSPVCQPLCVRALNRALAALNAQLDREKHAPANAGRSWSRTEDRKLCEELQQGHDINDIARDHNRTVPAIAARLVKLGKVAPPKGKDGPLFPGKVA